MSLDGGEEEGSSCIEVYLGSAGELVFVGSKSVNPQLRRLQVLIKGPHNVKPE